MKSLLKYIVIISLVMIEPALAIEELDHFTHFNINRDSEVEDDYYVVSENIELFTEDDIGVILYYEKDRLHNIQGMSPYYDWENQSYFYSWSSSGHSFDQFLYEDKVIVYKYQEVMYSRDVLFDEGLLGEPQLVGLESYEGELLNAYFTMYSTDINEVSNYNRKLGQDETLAEMFTPFLTVDDFGYVVYTEGGPYNPNVYDKSADFRQRNRLLDYSMSWSIDNTYQIRVERPYDLSQKVFKVEFNNNNFSFILPKIDYISMLMEEPIDEIDLFLFGNDGNENGGILKIISYDFSGNVITEEEIEIFPKPFQVQFTEGGEGYLSGHLPSIQGKQATEYEVIYPDGSREKKVSNDGKISLYYPLEDRIELLNEVVQVYVKHPMNDMFVRTDFNFWGEVVYSSILVEDFLDEISQWNLNKFTDDSVEKFVEIIDLVSDKIGYNKQSLVTKLFNFTSVNALNDDSLYEDSGMLLNIAVSQLVLKDDLAEESEKETDTNSNPKNDSLRETENDAGKSRQQELPATGVPYGHTIVSSMIVLLGVMLTIFSRRQKR